MSEKEIERCIKNATFSLEMEGFSVDEQTKEWCRKLLGKEISMDEFIALVCADDRYDPGGQRSNGSTLCTFQK